MKTIGGILLIVLGILLGLYVGLWLMFIGGIVALIHECQLHQSWQTINGMVIALSIARIVFAGVVGTIAAWVCILPGFGLVTASGISKARNFLR